MKSGPPSPQLERALAQKRGPNIAINQSINKSLKKKKNCFKKKKKTVVVSSLTEQKLREGIRQSSGWKAFEEEKNKMESPCSGIMPHTSEEEWGGQDGWSRLNKRKFSKKINKKEVRYRARMRVMSADKNTDFYLSVRENH